MATPRCLSASQADESSPLDERHPLRRAFWVWPHTELILNQYAQFRKDFDLAAVPARAPFFISADQWYRLYVNGRYVCRGPARGFQVSWPYDEVDLARFLRRGHNWISVEAYNPGISTFQYIHQGVAGFIAAGRWGGGEVVSGPGWAVRLAPGQQRWAGRYSIQMGFQEIADARRTERAWITGARGPAGWEVPVKTAMHPGTALAFGSMPWHSMEPRGVPMFTNRLRRFERAVSEGVGPCAADYRAWLDPASGWCRERDGIRWKTLSGAVPDAVAPSGKGKLRAIVLDIGQPTVANLLVNIAGGRGGEIVDFLFTEVLDGPAPNLPPPAEQHCAMSVANRLILRRGVTRHEFFHLLGFRYLTLIVRDSTGPLRVSLRARESIADLKEEGRFQSSDAGLNAIWRICRRTQRNCCLDAYVDTPWREQAQYFGDARVQALNSSHLASDVRLLRRGIRQLAFQETPNGLTYSHAPTMAHMTVIPDFSLIWILTLWDYYWQTGDASLVREYWPRIRRILAYFDNEAAGRHGLLKHDPRYWLFLDWADIHRSGAPSLLSLWYLKALDKLSRLLQIAGMDVESRQVGSRCRKIKQAILSTLWDARTAMFLDGLDERGHHVKTHGIHTQVLAMLAGLRPEMHERWAQTLLLPHVAGRDVPGPKPSSYWIHYEFQALRRMGYGREVVECIRREWGRMVPYGGTFEAFDMEFGVFSVSHAWSAHPLCHLAATVGGVAQTAPGWRQVRFAPILNAGVSSASVSVPAPQGVIRAEWRKDGMALRAVLDLPRGVTAQVDLPGCRETARGRKTWSLSVKEK